MRRIFLIYHVVLTEGEIKFGEEPQTGRNVSKPSAQFAGRKYLYLSEGQLIAALVIIAKLIGDDLPAVSGISAGTRASSSAGVRKNVETRERAFEVLLYLCSAKAIGRSFGQVFSQMD